MKQRQPGFAKLLATGLAALVLPTAAIASAPFFNADCDLPGLSRHFGRPAGAGSAVDDHFSSAMRPPLPLHRLGLSETQRDKLFELMHAQAPRLREQAKTSTKAIGELRRLVASDQYDADQARVLAEAAARTLADTMLTRAELAAQVRRFLTAEQQKLFDESLAGMEFHKSCVESNR